MNDSQETIIYQVENIDFVFSNYLNFPKAERTYFYIELLDTPITINKLSKKYQNYLYGFYIQLKDFENKKITGEETILMTSETQVCFFYMEYRILFFFDLSQSMFNYDFAQKQIYNEKVEIYTKLLLESFNEFELEIYNLNYDIIKFKPKIILGIACSSSEDDLKMILHEIILDPTNLSDYYLNLLIQKLHNKIMSFNNNKDTHPILPSTLNGKSVFSENNYRALDLYIRNQSRYLNNILEYTLYYLDLLPRTASPILFLITDSNLCFSYFGKYNNILMQYGRIDISIQIIDLFDTNKFNKFTPPSSINSINLFKDITKFTNGNYFPIDYLNDFFGIKKKESNKNILSYNLKKTKNYRIKSEVSINCKCCKDTLSMFFCKKPFHEYNICNNNIYINQNVNDNNKICSINFNINAINYFNSNKINIMQKEVFQVYELNVPFYLISQARVRESFFYKRSKKKNSSNQKFQIHLFPDICIIYKIISKDNLNENEGYTIQIEIKSTYSKLNTLKTEYIQNSHDIAVSHSFSTHIEIVMNFIKEIICTDKGISFFCRNFSEEQDFQTEKDLFIKKNKFLWDSIFNLSIHTWHRFFDVDIIESLVINRINDINDENIMSFILKDKQYPLSYHNQRSLIENQIYKFCDTINKDLKIGIKLIPKSENNSKKKYLNGLMIMKIDWIRDNLMLLYIGFFQCFHNTRINLRDKLINEIQNTTKNSDINIQTSPFHLRLLLTKKINIFKNQEFLTIPYEMKEVEDEHKNESGSIFTYTVGNKLILSYLIVNVSETYTFSRNSILMKFVKFVILQRLRENFSILNTDINSITLISKFNVLNIINCKDIIPEKIYKHQIVLIYTISVFEQDKIKIELAIEPNHSFYIFKCNEKTVNIYDKEKFISSLIKYFKSSEYKIFSWIKFYDNIMKSIESFNLQKKKINLILFNSKNFTSIKKKNENFIKKIKKYLSKFQENSVNNKGANLQTSLTFIKKIDFYLNLNSKNNLEYIKKKIIISLNDIFTSIQDYSLINVDNLTYYGKLFSTSTIIFFSFPSKNLLLQNTIDLNKNSVLTIKFYYITIDSLKQMDNEFYEELLNKKELSSFKTENISKEVLSLLNEYNEHNNYLKPNSNISELKNIIKDNEIFELNIDDFLNNLYTHINYHVILVKKYNFLIHYLLNEKEKIEDILKELYYFEIKYPLTNILKKSEYGFDFILNKMDEMIKNFFIQVYYNYYTNEFPENEEYDSTIEDFNMSFLKNPSKVQQKKYYFIMELFLEVNEEKFPFIIEKDWSFKLFLEKINFKGEEDINLDITYYFIPDYKDFFTDIGKNKYDITTIINRDEYSIYFYNENNEIQKQSPLYFESKKEEYFFEINKSIKLFMNRIIRQLTSFKTINEIEKLRKEINSTQLTNEELNAKVNKGYSMIGLIQNKHFVKERRSFSIVSNADLVNYINLFSIKYSDFFVFDFINDKLEEIKKIRKVCLETKDIDCTPELYKIPFWMKFILLYDEKNIRTITIDVKWLYITKENTIDINNDLKKLIFNIIAIKLTEINKRMMIDNLRERNFYNFKEKNKSEESEKINEKKKEETKDKKELKSKDKNLFDISKEKDNKEFELEEKEKDDLNFLGDNFEVEGFQNLTEHSEKKGSKKDDKKSMEPKFSDETINSFFKEDINKYFQSPFNDIFTPEDNLDIDNIFKYIQYYFEKHYFIENIKDFYRIENTQEKDQIFIVSLSLNKKIKSKYNRNGLMNQDKKSFVSFSNEIQFFNQELETKNSSRSINEKIYEKKEILIQLYGITQPTNFIRKKIEDIFNINRKLEKFNNHILFFKKKFEIKKLPECEIFLEKTYNKLSNPLDQKYENLSKYDDVINSFYEKTNKVWDKLLETNEIITPLDNELLITFSDKYELINKFDEFNSLTELSKAFIDFTISYFKSFNDNKIKIFKVNDYVKKIYLTFDDLLHSENDFENEYNDYNENSNDENINKEKFKDNSNIKSSEFAFLITATNSDDGYNKETNYSYDFELIRRKKGENSHENLEDIINKSDKLNYVIYKLIEELQYIETLNIMNHGLEL